MTFSYIANGSTLTINESECTGCGICTMVCPHRVLVMQKKVAKIMAPKRCIECGACSRNCAFEAISVRTGVGCAEAILNGKLKGTAPDCGCSTNDCCG